MKLLDFYRYQRYAGTPGQRFWYVFLFLLSCSPLVLAVITHEWFWVNYINAALGLFWGWVSWPTLIGTTATKTGKVEDDTTRNS